MRHASLPRILVGLALTMGILASCALSTPPTSDRTPTPTSLPTQTPLPGAQLISHADAALLCSGVFAQDQRPVYRFENDLYALVGYGLDYPFYKLPTGVPLQPFVLQGETGSSQLAAQFAGTPWTNPDMSDGAGLLMIVCNDSGQNRRIEGVKTSIDTFAPFSGAVEQWNQCDGIYDRQRGVTGVGCGGAQVLDETLHADFLPTATAGALVTARQVEAAGMQGFGPLPVELPPGRTLAIGVGVTVPHTDGLYSFSLGLVVGGAPIRYATTGAARLFAPVAHKWNGDACLTPAMQAQIPAATTPPTYYICPQM